MKTAPVVSDAEAASIRRIAQAVRDKVRAADPKDFAILDGMGADGTPTKRVDTIAEREVLRVAADAKLAMNILSEEAGFVDRGEDRLLVVDPVDGTTNAYNGVPFYCVSLAVGRKRLSDVSYGLVVNIPTGDVYEARKGRGATLNGRPIRGRAFHPEDSVASIVLGKRATRAGLELARRITNVRALGAAALEMSLVAQGAMDVYYHGLGSLRCVDIAASALILDEAGGRSVDLAGKPLDMALDLVDRAAVLAVGDPTAVPRLEVLG